MEVIRGKTMEETARKRISLLVNLMKPSSPKNPMFIGMMYPALKMPKMHSNKLLYSLSDFLRYSMGLENLGQESYSMVRLELVKPSWQKLVLPKHKAHFFQFHLQTL